MVHAIRTLKCKNGHSNFSLSFDSNECGCHHNGDPCLIISCRDCFIEALKNDTPSYEGDVKIPIGKDTMEEFKELLK